MDRSKWEYKKLGDCCKVINGLWTGKKPPYVNVGVIRNAEDHGVGSTDHFLR